MIWSFASVTNYKIDWIIVEYFDFKLLRRENSEKRFGSKDIYNILFKFLDYISFDTVFGLEDIVRMFVYFLFLCDTKENVPIPLVGFIKKNCIEWFYYEYLKVIMENLIKSMLLFQSFEKNKRANVNRIKNLERIIYCQIFYGLHLSLIKKENSLQFVLHL